MNKSLELSRRQFVKAAGIAAAASLAGINIVKVAEAAAMDFVGKRQASVYSTDADKKIYKYRKSQDNPMIKKLYAKDGFLHEGPCGHRSHQLLHTHYYDRSKALKALKAKGVKLAL